MPPMGLASIAAVCRNAGHTVTIFDAALSQTISNEQWARRIIAFTPDIVGFSAITSSFLDAYDCAVRIKNANTSIKTVFGGPHASWGKDLLLRKFDAIDYIIAGEGEFSFCKLADGIAPESIEGLHYRNNGAIEKGPLQIGCDMDDLPFPAYDLLDGFPRKYLMPLFSYPKHPGANVISSRGCVYQCSYCDRSVFGKTFRFNSPKYTSELVKKLATDFGVRHINFYDDLFTMNRPRVSELCELLIQHNRRVSFNCIVRLGHIDDDLLKVLKKAGCFMVNVGIESGDQDILDKHKSGLTLETIRGDIARIAAAGIFVKGLFMMGFPGETAQSIAKTKAFALSLPIKDANMTAFTPFPGAPISKDIRGFGEFDEDWAKMDCEHFVFVPNQLGSKKLLETLNRDFIKSFYQRKQMRLLYMKMLFRAPHSYYRLMRHAAAFLPYALSLNRTES